MACAQKNLLSLVEGRARREREGINLLVHACHSISLFSFVVSNFLFFFHFCHPSLTSDGVSYFLIPYSLWPTPFIGRALLDYRLLFL